MGVDKIGFCGGGNKVIENIFIKIEKALPKWWLVIDRSE